MPVVRALPAACPSRPLLDPVDPLVLRPVVLELEERLEGLAEQKGVLPKLLAQGRAGPHAVIVPRPDLGRGRERADLPVQGIVLEARGGRVRSPADLPDEQRIAGDEPTLDEEADALEGVTGRVDHDDFGPSDRDAITVLEGMISPAMHGDPGAGQAADRIVTARVIGVAVGIQDPA